MAPGAGGGRPFATADAFTLGALLLTLVAAHAANAWEGRSSDRANRKGWPVASGGVGGRALLTLASAAVLGAAFLAVRLPLAAGAILAASLLLGFLYAAPPIALKRRPWLDLLANAVGYGGLAFALGALGGGAGATGTERNAPGALATAAGALGVAGPYLLGVAALTMATMIADREGDERAGVRTSGVALGAPRGARLATGLAWGAAVAGLLARDPVPALWGTVAGVVLARDRPETQLAWNRTARVLIALFLGIELIAGSWAAPVFAALAALLSAPYYRARTGSGYPISGAFGCT